MSLKSTIEKNERIYQLENALRDSLATIEIFYSHYDEKLTEGESQMIRHSIALSRKTLEG